MYLSIRSTSDNASIIGVRHHLCLENIVLVTRMERQLNFPSLPVPENNPPIIRTRHQNVTICIEAYSVHTTSVLFQLRELFKSKHKILKTHNIDQNEA